MIQASPNKSPDASNRVTGSVRLRDATPGDCELLYRITHEAMHDYVVATWGAWNEARVRDECALAVQQESTKIIVIDQSDVGVLSASWMSDYVQLEQIYLLREYQRCGVGSQLLGDLIVSAKQRNLPIRLRVLAVNPARYWYEKFGFIATESTSERVFMELQP
jgi:GNAT superfamily N-acetyltransferase